METFALVIMAVGSWVLVIGMIAVLGTLYKTTNTASQETAQNSVQDTETVVYIDGANNAPAEDQEADVATRAAA